jgi:dTDP-4-dehydrorhamnose 3,5-epimerase
MGTTVALDRIVTTTLARIPTPGGDVMHAMRETDDGYGGFGEAYFSWVDRGAIKAWKQHQRMTMNLVVPFGEVRFVFLLETPQRSFREERIGTPNYTRLTVPPGIWFGFQGMAERNLVLNVASIAHDPSESLRRDLDEIPYDWTLVAS